MKNRTALASLLISMISVISLPPQGRAAEPSAWETLLDTQRSASAAVFIVRHAEKVESDDQPLSEAGRLRAAALAEILSPFPIAEVWSTRFERTEDTAIPTAERFSLKVGSYDGVEEIASHLLGLDDGKHVLVVGHSNTVPEILRRLGVAAEIHIDYQQYDRIFVVQLTGESATLRVFRHDPGSSPRFAGQDP